MLDFMELYILALFAKYSSFFGKVAKFVWNRNFIYICMHTFHCLVNFSNECERTCVRVCGFFLSMCLCANFNACPKVCIEHSMDCRRPLLMPTFEEYLRTWDTPCVDTCKCAKAFRQNCMDENSGNRYSLPFDFASPWRKIGGETGRIAFLLFTNL